MLSASALSLSLLASTLLPSLTLAAQHDDFLQRRTNTRDSKTCKCIANKISNSSSVYYPGSSQYSENLQHYMTSSQEDSTCVFVPKTPEDIATALKIIADEAAPFAISSGGHASNAKQSSTQGVQISMKGFQEVKLSDDKSYVDIGSGLIWDNVYKALQGTGVNVVGARAPGIGVGGMILGGGGYSFLSDQYGLTVDTLIQADMVLPDGSLKTVTSKDKDLFFAIKGGGNRFGIPYSFRIKTFPQGEQVWGGNRFCFEDQFEAAIQAVDDFIKNNKDPKASILPTFNFSGGTSILVLIAFYDGPTSPEGTFAVFDKAFALVDDWKTKTYLELIQGTPSAITANQRGDFDTVSLQSFSLPLLNQIVNQTKFYGNGGSLRGGILASIAVEPFQQYGKFSQGGAFDHSNSPLPLHFYFAWSDQSQDDYFRAGIKSAASVIAQQAEAEGQKLDDLKLYPNYAISNTSGKKIFGKDNADRLEKIRRQYDPTDLMLTAGNYFKFTY